MFDFQEQYIGHPEPPTKHPKDLGVYLEKNSQDPTRLS